MYNYGTFFAFKEINIRGKDVLRDEATFLNVISGKKNLLSNFVESKLYLLFLAVYLKEKKRKKKTKFSS